MLTDRSDKLGAASCADKERLVRSLSLALFFVAAFCGLQGSPRNLQIYENYSLCAKIFYFSLKVSVSGFWPQPNGKKTQNVTIKAFSMLAAEANCAGSGLSLIHI